MASSENNPVLLLHGWGGNFRDTWQKPGIDALLNDIGRVVIEFNLLGHGDQEKPHDPAAYERLPDWLLENIPASHPVVDVVAFSLGALTTLRAMTTDPARFGRVILAGIGDGVFDPPESDRHHKIVSALEGHLDENDPLSRMFVHYASQPGNDLAALTAIMKRPAAAPLVESELARFERDVLVVIGDKDFASPANRLASAFPSGKLVTLRNTDHFATTDSFQFIDAILDFFAQ